MARTIDLATLPSHWKPRALAEKLDVEVTEAIGILICLWAHAERYERDGAIGRRTNYEIAAACHWDLKRADELVRALVAAELLHHSDRNRLVIHDWAEYSTRRGLAAASLPAHRNPEIDDAWHLTRAAFDLYGISLRDLGNRREKRIATLLVRGYTVHQLSIAVHGYRAKLVPGPDFDPARHFKPETVWRDHAIDSNIDTARQHLEAGHEPPWPWGGPAKQRESTLAEVIAMNEGRRR